MRSRSKQRLRSSRPADHLSLWLTFGTIGLSVLAVVVIFGVTASLLSQTYKPELLVAMTGTALNMVGMIAGYIVGRQSGSIESDGE